MLDTEVVILAQDAGTQFGYGLTPRHLSRLPACDGYSIIARTIAQVRRLTTWWPTVITWDFIQSEIAHDSGLACVQLEDPGNSALKGVARYLELRAQQGRRYERTIVLLGDVVYSWACLKSIWEMSGAFGFVGTKDLSLEKGDLWGVAWCRLHEERMLAQLRDALLRHPLGDEHCPSQLRRWITGWQRGRLEDHVARMRRVDAYIDIDDYTHDIDVPMDLVMLPDLSQAAAADDLQSATP